jgi:hypothetical protein
VFKDRCNSFRMRGLQEVFSRIRQRVVSESRRACPHRDGRSGKDV